MTDWAITIGIVVVLALGVAIVGWVKQRRRQARERVVELAAAVAADDDPAFAPDAVRAAAARLFVEAQDARDRCDRAALAELLTPELFVEWRRQLDEIDRKGWYHRVDVRKLRSVEYLGLVNRAEEADDRVTVRICASMRDFVMTGDGTLVDDDGADAERDVALFWTLAKRPGGDGWVVASVESDGEGAHVLGAEVVAAPWHDERRMTDASLLEVAALDRLPDGAGAAEVADLDYADDARLAALDISLVDGRFAPEVLEAAVRRAVEAWASAVDGAKGDLLDIATPEAAHALLHPSDPSGRTRLVIRGPHVSQLTITALDPAAEPPRMTVELEVTGRRYLQDRDTAKVVTGVPSLAIATVEHWTLALSGPDERPWQIVATASSPRPRARRLDWRGLVNLTAEIAEEIRSGSEEIAAEVRSGTDVRAAIGNLLRRELLELVNDASSRRAREGRAGDR